MGSLNPGRLSALSEGAKGRSRAALERYRTDSTGMQSRWLVGRVVFTALSAVLVAVSVEPYVPRWAFAPVGALGALLSYGTMAEVATTIARAHADYVATALLPLLRPLEWLIYPLGIPATVLGRLANRWFGADPHADARLIESEVEWAVTEGQKSGSLGQEPAEMIRNVLDLKDLVASDVMVPRTRVTAIEVERPLADVLQIVSSEGHSRYPVYRDKIDNVVGLLYAKDLFRVLHDGKLAGTRLYDIMRAPVNFVPESQGLSSVLREMRQRRLHMAIVIDEYGGVSGLVTLEDILEEIVGEIHDEYDTEEAPIQDLGDGRLLVDAAVSVHDLSAYLGADIPTDDDYDSLGGMLTHRSGRVPEAGTQLDLFGLSFIVRDADEKRISRVEIVRPPPPATMPPPASDRDGAGSGPGEGLSSESRKVASAAS